MLHHNQDSKSCALKTHQSFLMDYEHAAGHTVHFHTAKAGQFFWNPPSQLGQAGQTLREAISADRLSYTQDMFCFSQHV